MRGQRKNPRKAVQPFENKKRKIDIFKNYEANGVEKIQRKLEIFSTLISKKSKLVPFENEKNIVWNMLSHLGSDGQVDIVVAAYDEDFLERRNCTALKLRDLQLSICMSSTHKLAQKEKISIEDLVEATRRRGGGLLLRSDDWMRGYDNVKEIFTHDERIEKEFYDFLTMDILNRCGNSNYFLLATESWIFSHPLIKAVPLDINATLPFGAIHSKKPSEPVKKFLRIVDFVNLEYKNFQLW